MNDTQLDVRNVIEVIGSLFPNQDDLTDEELGYSNAINDAITVVSRMAQSQEEAGRVGG